MGEKSITRMEEITALQRFVNGLGLEIKLDTNKR